MRKVHVVNLATIAATIVAETGVAAGTETAGNILLVNIAISYVIFP